MELWDRFEAFADCWLQENNSENKPEVIKALFKDFCQKNAELKKNDEWFKKEFLPFVKNNSVRIGGMEFADSLQNDLIRIYYGL